MKRAIAGLLTLRWLRHRRHHRSHHFLTVIGLRCGLRPARGVWPRSRSHHQHVDLRSPPGTGKTLLARAVAGEARGVLLDRRVGVHRSDLGVGAARVRDLFARAKERRRSSSSMSSTRSVGMLSANSVHTSEASAAVGVRSRLSTPTVQPRNQSISGRATRITLRRSGAVARASLRRRHVHDGRIALQLAGTRGVRLSATGDCGWPR